jgi:hypothetical protein
MYLVVHGDKHRPTYRFLKMCGFNIYSAPDISDLVGRTNRFKL